MAAVRTRVFIGERPNCKGGTSGGLLGYRKRWNASLNGHKKEYRGIKITSWNRFRVSGAPEGKGDLRPITSGGSLMTKTTRFQRDRE